MPEQLNQFIRDETVLDFARNSPTSVCVLRSLLRRFCTRARVLTASRRAARVVFQTAFLCRLNEFARHCGLLVAKLRFKGLPKVLIESKE